MLQETAGTLGESDGSVSNNHANSYDTMPYPDYAFPQTHPDHLAVQARLFGLQSPPPSNARVLELGCAAGGNLIPLAVAYPDMQLIGLDLSKEQIARGQQCIESLNLSNLELRQASITDVDDTWGKFDYIICHGVYSWVEPEVQDKILDICLHHLTDSGVGYVSYNTFPGWHMRGSIRNMMGYHTSRILDQPPAVQVAQARELLRFMAHTLRVEQTPYSLFLQRELETLQKQPDSYLFHEHLEENNDPLYFYEFYQQLTAKGLRYLGEADLSVMLPANYPPDAQQYLQKLAPNQILMEQYLDFLRNRSFRQTLICLPQHKPDYRIEANRLAGLTVVSVLRPSTAQPDLAAKVSVKFDGPNELNLSTDSPVVKAALVLLAQAMPRGIRFEDLVRQVAQRLGANPDQPEWLHQATTTIARAILTGLAKTNVMFELWWQLPEIVTAVSERPQASPAARWHAERENRVTNLRHRPVNLSEFDRRLLPLLDGSRTHSELVEAMQKIVAEQGLNIQQDGKPVTDPPQQRQLIARMVEQQLPRMAVGALLIG